MLNPKEIQVLRLLAEGFAYPEVASKAGVNPLSMAIFCYRIRLKTGIASTKSAAQCKEWLDQNPDLAKAKAIPTVKPPTPKQIKAMELYAVRRLSFEKIAWEMGITKQNAAYYLNTGMARAHLQPRCSTSDRRAEIIAYLQPDPMNDPAF